MKKALAVSLVALLAACSSNTVEIDEQVQFKCGNEIINVTFYDDESMSLFDRGQTYMLTLNEAAPGSKYENIAQQIIFWDRGGNEYYLEMQGQGYPNCRAIVK